MLLLDESIAYLLIGDVQFNTYHKATAAYIDNMREGFVLEAGHQVVAYLSSIVNQMLVLNNIQNSKCTGASQVVAAKGGAQLTVFGLEAGRRQA